MTKRALNKYKFRKRYDLDVWGNLLTHYKKRKLTDKILIRQEDARRYRRKRGPKIRYKRGRKYSRKSYADIDRIRDYRIDQSMPPLVRKRTTFYGRLLQFKQNLRKYYGWSMTERQFKRIFIVTKKLRYKYKHNYLLNYERRLDVALFRSHLTTASSMATKQRIVHRKICVNGQIITKPNYKLKLGDIISFSDPDEGFMANFIFMKQRQHLLDQHLKQFSRRRRRIFKLLRRKTPPYLDTSYKLLCSIFSAVPTEFNTFFPFRFKSRKLKYLYAFW